MSVDFAELKKTHRGRILTKLLDLEWHPHYELADIGGNRYSARLLELKRLGYKIEREPIGEDDTGFKYRLKSATPGTPKVKTVKVFLNENEAEAILARLRGMHYRGAHHELGAQKAVESALNSFRLNKHKL